MSITLKRRSGILRIPVVIAIVSLIGLATGLLGERGHDFVAWIGLSIPVIAIGYGIQRSRAR